MINLIIDLVRLRSKITLKLLKSVDFDKYFEKRCSKDHQTIWLTKDITLSHQDGGEERRYLLDAFGVEGSVNTVFVKVLWSANIYKEIAYVLDQISQIIFSHAPGLNTDTVLTRVSQRLPGSYEALEGMSARSFLRRIISVSIDVIKEEFSDAV